jgi:sugar diacid utilization regulator
MSYPEEIEAIIHGLFEDVYQYEWIDKNTLTLTIPFFEEMEISLESIEEIMIGDLSTAISIFLTDPMSLEQLNDYNQVFNHFVPVLKSKHMGIFNYEELLFDLLLSNKNLDDIKDLLIKPFDHDLIQIVNALMANNLNLSTTAKTLFLHRNTLNYKLDKALKDSMINLKSFKGCMTAYLIIRLI